jgi:hypothetical protein
VSGSFLGGGGASSRRIHFVVVSSTDDWFWEYPEFFFGGLISGKGFWERVGVLETMMEERIMKMLEKMGWHLQPSAVPYILQRLQQEEEEEEEGARVEEKDKKNWEKRVHNKLLDMDMSVVGARFLPDPHSLLQLHSLPTTPCVVQVPHSFIQSFSHSFIHFFSPHLSES